MAHGKTEKTEIEPISTRRKRENIFWKPLGPNGSVISMVSWKAGAPTNRTILCLFSAFWHHLGVCWCHFGAHWMSKESQDRSFFEQTWTNWEKGGPRNGFRKTWFFDWFLMPKWEAWNCKKEVFASYLLQIKTFRRSGKLIEKEMPKSHPKWHKIEPWAIKGLSF